MGLRNRAFEGYGKKGSCLFLVSIEEAKTSHVVTGIICKSKQIITFSRSALFSIYLFIAPQGFGPDGQNPRIHPRGPRVLGTKISSWQKKNLDFSRAGLAKDCRKFAGSRINPLHFIKKKKSGGSFSENYY